MKKENMVVLILAIAMFFMCAFALGYMYSESKSDGPNYPETPDSSIEVYKDSIEWFVYKSMDSLIKENFKLKEDAILKIKYITKTIYLNENKKKIYLNSVDSTKLYVSDSILRANGVRK